jgi:hypothetical protein
MAETSIGTPIADQVQPSAGSPTNGLSSTVARSKQDDAAERLRGVVALPHERAVLLTDEVELDAEKLPRRQPHINVDERRLIDDGPE